MRVPCHLDLFHTRRGEQKSALNPDAVRGNPANGKTGIGAAFTQAHDSALKNLNTLAVAFDDAGMYPDPVPGLEFRNIRIRFAFRDDGY